MNPLSLPAWSEGDVVTFLVAGRQCRVDGRDLRRLAKVSGSDWRWTSGTSRGRSHPVARRRQGGASIMLARLIAQAGDWDEIAYRNGDPWDLRRANLLIRRQQRRVRRSPMPA